MKVAILHIAWNLEIGGVQTWLLALAKNFDRGRFLLDFAVHEDRAGSLANEIRAVGCRVHILEKDASESLAALLRTFSYKVAHLHFCPAYNPLRVAKRAKVPLRVFHNHNSLAAARRLYRRWGHDAANARFSVSRKAAFLKFGWRSFLPHYYEVQPAGIDLEPFRRAWDRSEIRRALGISEGAFVVGHVGRLARFKNHAFLLQIMAQLEKDSRLLLVGEGPERETIYSTALRLGIADRVHFAGDSREVARLLHAMDIFVFPSLRGEGLPLALIEAQAAGLPCLVSDHVSAESEVMPSLVHWQRLECSPAEWARSIEAIGTTRHDPIEALRAVEASGFNVKRTVESLENFYLSRLSHVI